MSGPERVHAYGCEKHSEDTYEACYQCDLEHWSDVGSKYQRLTWLVRQLLQELPQKRDWFNPDVEREMRAAVQANTSHE